MNENLIAQVPVPTINGVVTLKAFEAIFQNLLTAVLGLAGIVLFIVLIIGGFQFMTAGGNPQEIESAKKTLTYGILGLVAVALSFMVLVFLRSELGLQDITNFQVWIEP